MTAQPTVAAPSPALPYGLPDGALRLYCLPHAGGSASAFHSWVGRVGRPGSVAVCPLQPPGRENRLYEEPVDDMARLVSGFADVVQAGGDRPWAVYGHSLGALVGFELVHELQRRGERAPEGLIVSGCPAPHLSETSGATVAGMTDDQVVGLLRDLGGTPPEFLTDRLVLAMIMPRVRADFGVKDGYRYTPRPPLTAPVTALATTADPRAGVESMLAWRDHTVGRFHHRIQAGGHFTVLEQPARTREWLASALAR